MRHSMIVARLWMVAILGAPTGLAIARDLTVSAAASLTEAFTEVARTWEVQHPGSRVVLNFGSSGALLQQMVRGAPVDVFASADQETMDAAVKQGLVAASDRRNFASNSLVLVVPADSKLPVKGLEDLRLAGVRRLAIGNPASVPVGRYTRHVLEAARLWAAIEPKMISTQNVRQSLDYVARGEVEAGFVYATDAAIVKDKVKVAFVLPLDTPVSYPVARLSGSGKGKEAQEFVDFVLSPGGQAVLTKFGFQKP